MKINCEISGSMNNVNTVLNCTVGQNTRSKLRDYSKNQRKFSPLEVFRLYGSTLFIIVMRVVHFKRKELI